VRSPAPNSQVGERNTAFAASGRRRTAFDRSRDWEGGKAKTVTMILTENCQLRCRYCYLVGKNSHHRMSFDVARRTVDYLLRERELFKDRSLIWDFMGGEPFLEIDLIDRISDYFKRQAYETGHWWFDSYRFSFATNGILYDEPRVQRYLEKNFRHVSVGITIDGTPGKHNLQRVYPDGRGSYDDVVRNIPLWLRQFPEASTKVTISRADLPHVKDSIVHLWELGIKNIHANVVFENAWDADSDKILEDQLLALADHIVDYETYMEHSCSFFARHIGRPNPENRNWCGAGKMLAVDHAGVFYPCVRFAAFSLQNRPPLKIGDCVAGIDANLLRPFLALDLVSQSPPECIECDIAAGCAWCQGANYDFADTATIYQRATYICRLHKARVRANRYFWDRLDRKLAAPEERQRPSTP
jgi:uncharacterized protein